MKPQERSRNSSARAEYFQEEQRGNSKKIGGPHLGALIISRMSSRRTNRELQKIKGPYLGALIIRTA